MTTSVTKFADEVNSALPNVKRGTLRIWGAWFGRPYDNIHTVTYASAEGNMLELSFNEGERLQVWAPDGVIVNGDTFRIRTANRVRWLWYPYGRPRTEENLCWNEYQQTGAFITTSSNTSEESALAEANSTDAAVELL